MLLSTCPLIKVSVINEEGRVLPVAMISKVTISKKLKPIFVHGNSAKDNVSITTSSCYNSVLIAPKLDQTFQTFSNSFVLILKTLN